MAVEARTLLTEEAAATTAGRRKGGPRTAEGLAASSANAMQHGLTGSGIHLPAELRDEVARWSGIFERRYRPIGEEAREHVEAAALAFAQYRGAIAEQTRYLVRRSEDALLHWDDRRIAEAEQLALKLPNRPGLVAASLRTSFRGVEWLLNRWQTLRIALETKGTWGEEEIALAHDLLGIDRLRRPYDPAGIASASAEERRAIVEEQCRDLQGRLSADHARFEESARDTEIEGNGYLLDKVYLKLARYAREAHRRYEKHIAALEEHRKSQPRGYREGAVLADVVARMPELRYENGLPPATAEAALRLIQKQAMRRPPTPPASKVPIAEPKPDLAPVTGDDRGRELRADPPDRTGIPRPRVPLNPEQRRQMEAARRKAAGSKARIPR